MFLTTFVQKLGFNLENLITIKEVSKGLTWFHQNRRRYRGWRTFCQNFSSLDRRLFWWNQVRPFLTSLIVK